MKMQLKEKTKKTKETIKKHKTKVIAGSVILIAAGGAVLYWKHLDKITLKKLNDILVGFKTVEGSGPVWDKIKTLFSEIDMKPGECWMVEAGMEEDIGKKLIARIPGVGIATPCEQMIF